MGYLLTCNVELLGMFAVSQLIFTGSSDPPRSRHQLVYAAPLYQMVIIGMFTGIGFILAVTFLVFNIVWRKDK